MFGIIFMTHVGFEQGKMLRLKSRGPTRRDKNWGQYKSLCASPLKEEEEQHEGEGASSGSAGRERRRLRLSEGRGGNGMKLLGKN